jgi:5'(3')-deoxyribonucleotidase
MGETSMSLLRVGVDLDGVLGDFNTAFIQRVIDVTGKDLFPPRPFDITTWDYPQHYGYTDAECKQVWADIAQDPSFWREEPKYPWTDDTMKRLGDLWQDGEADLYFVTSRPGDTAKNQTEMWLDAFDVIPPTVLISSEKGLCCKALKLDVYIDDKTENCEDVVRQSPDTLCFMLAQPWNHAVPGCARIEKIEQFFAAIEDALCASQS